MGAKTAISWTERTWNYFRGCSEKSSGCAMCYARLMAARFSGPGQPYEGIAYLDDNGKSHWTGKVVAVPDHLEDPIRWQRPSLIFTNSMSDLFHESAEREAIINSFEIMEKANWHIFQTLTKRPELMPEMLHSITLKSGRNLGKDPLPNVWIGTTMEDEKTAAERSKWLAQTPAAIRWWSAEPLIGDCDWKKWITASKSQWVVFGGESRQGEARLTRPMDLQWLRDGLAACEQLGVAAFVKQLGYWLASETLRPEKFKADPSGKKPECWPLDIRVQDYPIDIEKALKWDGKHHKVGNYTPLPVLNSAA
jgi:protein gp37